MVIEGEISGVMVIKWLLLQKFFKEKDMETKWIH